MRTNIGGILLTEVNRMREIMGMRLITEGGGVLGDLSSFFGKLLTKNVDELSVEERELAERMIKNSTELQSAGIKNLDQALSTQGKLILKNTLKNSKENVIDALRKSIDDYSQEAIRLVNKNIESMPTFKSSLKNVTTTQGSLLDVFKTIENEGLSQYNIPVLMQIRKKINSVSPNYASDPEVAKYLKDIDDSIGTYINSKNVDFGKQIDDLAGGSTNISSKSEMTNAIDEIEDVELKSYLNDVVSKLTDDEMKQIDNIVSKIPKEKEDEIIDMVLSNICTVKESRNIRKLSKLLTEADFRKGCGNASYLIKLFDPKKQRVPAAIFKMFLSIAVIVIGSVGLFDLIKGFFGWRGSGYEVNNPFDDTKTTEGEPGDIDKL